MLQTWVGSRTFQTSIGSKRDTTWLYRWVDGLIEKGEWGVTLIDFNPHGGEIVVY